MVNLNFPVFDLHCDLLSYMGYVQTADPLNVDDIGCALPSLKKGGVNLQVLAIYSAVEENSSDFGYAQSKLFQQLLNDYPEYLELAISTQTINELPGSGKTGVIAAIENAAGFCEEREHLDTGFKKLEEIINNVGRLLYISLTHHSENRFGGGNYCDIGLKADGRVLLDYLDGRKIAVDLSHTCDALAYDIIDHINKKGLDIPLMASHSNFRAVYDHPRNIRDEIVQEIINRKGVLGINFLRAFLNSEDPKALSEHIMYGMNSKVAEHLAFGADFFYTKDFPDPAREPFYYPTENDASMYPSILQNLSAQLSTAQLEALSYKNVLSFINRTWEGK